ncbi:hypothetical protein PR202_ga12544 [Eleusine coracana subsp. coracana]|uniref:Potassium transporter n=1 Tax=Eleusine coracana subsp. coracana TaxID=191504 RepID=A0AAV5CCH7_ELECO|nr:hypothetical protein PR202_ga12544 [Eleusine coracana subsp. coracana]
MAPPRAGSRSSMEIVPHSGDLELELPAIDVKRQDSLYRDANRPAHGDHHGQESWAKTLRLAFQCVGILYADLGTSPLYVYSNTFKGGIKHEDDVLGVLSIIIYSFVLFTMVKIVFIALYANDEGDGGTFALYSLISRYAKVCLIPNQQAEDELVSRYKHHTKPSATLSRAHWMKNLLETSKTAKISLFFLTIFATALAISDCMLTPPISVLAAVNGLKLRADHLTTDQVVWITVGILVAFFAVQRFGADKMGYTFAPLVFVWLLLISGIGIYNTVKHDIGTLRAFNPKYIIDYFRRNKKKGWVSLGEILLCFTGGPKLSSKKYAVHFSPLRVGTDHCEQRILPLIQNYTVITGTEALFADLGYFSIRSIQLSFTFGLLPSVLLIYIGQAAYLRKHIMDKTLIANAFFNAIPSAVLYVFTKGPYLPLAMSAVLMVIMMVWHYVHVKRYKYELEHTVSRDEMKQLLERQDLKRVPGLGLFYTELVQGIPPIFPHLIEKIPTIHSVIVFITVKRLPIPHVDVTDRFLFRQVEPKEFMVFRCVARYGYHDTLEMANDFVPILVEYLQYYVRDLNLYGVGEQLKIVYHSARVDSFSWEKPPGHGVYAEEMLTPIQSFSELTMHPVGMSRHFQTGKMNLEEMLKIEEDQKIIQREVDNGVVYIVGETEMVARPHSNLFKKIVVNNIYNFLRKNSRNGEKMLSIPRGQLLKVGVTYEI